MADDNLGACDIADLMALIGAHSVAELDRRFLALPGEMAGSRDAVVPVKMVQG